MRGGPRETGNPFSIRRATQENGFRNRPFTLVISVETLSETHGSWWCHRFLQGLLTGDQRWPLKWDISGHFRSFWSVLSYDIWYSGWIFVLSTWTHLWPTPSAPASPTQCGSEFRKNRALARALLQEPWRGGQMTHEDLGVRCVEKKQQEQVEFSIYNIIILHATLETPG